MDQDIRNVGQNALGGDKGSENALSKRFLLRLRELAYKGRFGKIRTQNQPYIKLLGILTRLLEMPAYPITLWGEEGTGKNLLADEISAFSNLLSRLEGHEVKAVKKIDGRLCLASVIQNIELKNNQTIIFDHVDALSKDLQKALLALLERRRELLDSSQLCGHRIIFLTRYSLSFKVLKKEFLRDLFIFLNPTLLCVPTLNERSVDLPFLFSDLLMDITGQVGHLVDPALIDHLENQIWGRNIDQLRQEIEARIPIFKNELRWTIEKWNLYFENKGPALSYFQPAPRVDISQQLEERKKLQHALHRAGGSRDQAARILGISKPELLRALLSQGIR
jgi:DNA-binding NtrC family response regulator